MMKTPKLAKHINALTGVRGAAVLLVFLAHLQQRYFPYQELSGTLISNFAYFGMTMFFVLSGFVIHWNYGPLFTTEPISMAWWKFFVARFSRLWPLHFAVALLAFTQTHNVYLFLQHLFMVQLWAYQGVANISYYNTWSISSEWFFYFAYAAIYPFLRRALQISGVWQLSFVVTVSYAITYWLGPNQNDTDMWLLYFAPYVRLLEFVTGIAAAQFVMTRRQKNQPVRSDLIFAIVFTATIALHGTQLWAHTNINYYIAPMIAVLLIVASDQQSYLARLFSARWLLWLGDRSYSIYLLEAVYLVHIRQIEPSFGYIHEPTRNFDWSSFVVGAIWVICSFALVLFIANFCWRYFEMPLRRTIKRVLSGSTKLPVATQT